MRVLELQSPAGLQYHHHHHYPVHRLHHCSGTAGTVERYLEHQRVWHHKVDGEEGDAVEAETEQNTAVAGTRRLSVVQHSTVQLIVLGPV